MTKGREARRQLCGAVLLALPMLLICAPAKAAGQEKGERANGQGKASATPSPTPELDEATQLDREVSKLTREGKYGEAIPLAERAAALREKALGAEHLDVARTQRLQRRAHRARGKGCETG